MNVLDSVGAACKRFGPGRLPYAHRREVGAGYAMATATAVATAAFIALTQTFGISTLMSSWYVGYEGALVEQAIGMASTVPAGFVAGSVVWRAAGDRIAGRVAAGPIAGLAAMALMYPLSALVDIVGLWLGNVGPLSATAVLEAVQLLYYGPILAVFMGYSAATTTYWLTLPLAAVGGFVYERTRAEAE